jgi:hypothetical protein
VRPLGRPFDAAEFVAVVCGRSRLNISRVAAPAPSGARTATPAPTRRRHCGCLLPTPEFAAARDDRGVTVVAGSIPLFELLGRLASTRPVFHSEADFQQAFAWEVRCEDPGVRVRLETHPEPDIRLDLLLSRPDLQAATAVELKYLTTRWASTVDGEHYALKQLEHPGHPRQRSGPAGWSTPRPGWR